MCFFAFFGAKIWPAAAGTGELARDLRDQTLTCLMDHSAPCAIPMERKHACAPRLSAYPGCIGSEPRLRGGYGALG